MASHSLAWHMEGCSCGEARLMTPLDYLTLCVRKRFESHQRLSGFTRKENVDSAAYGASGVVIEWQEKILHTPLETQGANPLQVQTSEWC